MHTEFKLTEPFHIWPPYECKEKEILQKNKRYLIKI